MPSSSSADRLPGCPPRRPALRPASDAVLLAALRRGEEAAFVHLVERDHAVLVGLARRFVRDRTTAEEVAQESWLAFLQGIDRFEGRASIRTYVCAIVVNKARSRAVQEARSVPMSALGSGDDQRPWTPAGPGRDSPEARLLGRETLGVLQGAIAALPERQRRVLVLRDLEGRSSDEACATLGLTEGNQRVLLHRARARVRQTLSRHAAGSRVA